MYRYIFLFIFFFKSALFSADPVPDPFVDPFSIQETPPPVYEDSNKFLAEFFYMLVMLGLLLGVVLLASWFLKRMVNTRYDQLNTTSSIKVLERRALSPKTSLYLISCDEEEYLIVESPTSVIQLHPTATQK